MTTPPHPRSPYGTGSPVASGPRPSATVMLLVLLAALGLAASLGDDEDRGQQAPAGAPDRAPDAAAPEPAEDEPLDDLPDDTVMVWSGARLGEGYAERVAADPRVASSTVVRGGTLGLVRTRTAQGEVVDELPEGWWYPVEVLAFEPERYDALAGRRLLGDLDPDQALLGATSAEVRGLGEGDVLEFVDGTRLRIAGILPDELVGAAEVAVTVDAPLEVTTEKFLLARAGDEDARAALRQLGTDDREPQLVPHGTTPVLRHAHGVLPQVQRKAHFGEFAMQDRPGRDIRAGHSWVEEHITVASVPILGRVQCHRELIEPLRAAMQELVERGAEHVIDDYAGCWVARTSGSDGPLSSHAWGMSIDFNARANPYGGEPRQPEVLVEVMTDHGFAWGGDWDVPDAMHFELAPGRDTTDD